MKTKKFKFIDLFAGIGGFHYAMEDLGGKCVFASEIDSFAIDTYKKNFNIDANINIKEVDVKDIPFHDVLCAGFPCQTFSKAGKQKGLKDTRGTLFFEIERILRHHKTKYIILENVRNLVSHDKGNTWATMYNALKSIGYRLTNKPIVISPHNLGIPQLRERVLILGIYDPENCQKSLNIDIVKKYKKKDNNIYSIIEKKRVSNKYYLNDYEKMVLRVWDEFYKGISQKIIGFPIWSEYFKEEIILEEDLPKWKRDFIVKNQKLYVSNKDFIDRWLKRHNNLKKFIPTHRKLEWQAGITINSLWEGVIQFRPSGIRVKAPDCFPALVAMVQVPIIGKYKRRITIREAARLQSFPESFIPNKNVHQAYKQLGNAVNVEIVKFASNLLFNYSE